LVWKIAIFRNAAVENPSIIYLDVDRGMVVTDIVFLCGIQVRTTPDVESTYSI